MLTIDKLNDTNDHKSRLFSLVRLVILYLYILSLLAFTTYSLRRILQLLTSLEQYQAIIFDMDGTLINSMPSHVEAWRKTADHFQFPFDATWLHSLGGMPSPKITVEINREYGLSLDPTEVSKYKTDTFQAIEDKGDLIPETYEILKSIKTKKPVAIGTGSQRFGAEGLLKATGIFDWFDTIVTATEIENHKPNPDTFLLAAKQMQCEPSKCAVFEDTQLGLQAAHAAGMDCFLVTKEGIKFHPTPD